MTVFKAIKKKNAIAFTSALLPWWWQHKRDFLWRQTDDPYQLLIAESLLRRTNAPAAHKVYITFLERFPSVKALVTASPEDIRELVQPLGLEWRAENLVSLVAYLKQNLEIPETLDALLKMPGVGPYVSRAILVNAAEYKSVAVDSNIVRVICRYFGIPENDNLRRNKSFQTMVDSIIYDTNARELNYALLDLAAIICRPSAPKCVECPVSEECKYNSAIHSGRQRL